MTGEPEGLGGLEGCYRVEGPKEITITWGSFPEFHVVPVSKAQKPPLDQGSPSPLGVPVVSVPPRLVWGTLGQVDDMEGMHPSPSLPCIVIKMPLLCFGVEETPYSNI